MSYRFTDTHCHFDFPPFYGQEAQSLALAQQAGVRQIIVPAVTADRFARVLRLAREHSPLYAALGLHPLYIAQHGDEQLAQLADFLASKPAKLVAVGEIGLDLYMAEPQLARQQRLLAAQLKLAGRHDLPVILHSRRSHDQLAAMLRRADVPRRGVVHGFAGSLAQAQAFVRLGYFIGVGGTITYPRAQKTRGVMAQLPLAALLLETDAPDMPLAGYQGQPNRPERAADVFQALCLLRPEPAETIATQLQQNTRTLFAI
ncbi:TatD DNase family protein [Gibbsiella quercinecans]|uniref:Deoxyribonuclease YjjV n=1 Tax=Gibbsiella quercinecans TaxID=929813 RepID=A0A250AZX9_9GAMM|nr:TatD family hydrolase [Gibbsiella quercinecans]ATA19464.1 deoxyribonuclease YjjV [Gibbsiella quercinecans]RLM11345.1 metal-dependent hydrolase [Gibbsiella quercinecans]RLM13943.1 metal-dependent hydrolase [Gibbsiella quercinecans]TCT90347.1 TatD DNase family protein [Gibbsiella quercinecans]